MNPQNPVPTSTPAPAPTPLAKQNTFLLPAVLGALLVLALVFGGWAFSSKQSAQKQANQTLAKADLTLKDAQAHEAAANAAEQKPYKTYTSSATYGSISFSYPKNWSAYVDETGSSQVIDAYFHPNQVPGIQSGTAFALRAELVSDEYSGVITQISGQQGVSASAFLPTKLKGNTNAQVGTRFDGPIAQDSSGNDLNGAMVVLKVRDKTFKIYTESSNYLSDFNNIVLPSLSYNP